MGMWYMRVNRVKGMNDLFLCIITILQCYLVKFCKFFIKVLALLVPLLKRLQGKHYEITKENIRPTIGNHKGKCIFVKHRYTFNAYLYEPFKHNYTGA